MPDQQTISAYDTNIAEYAKMVDDMGQPSGLVKFIAAVQTGGRVLDLGCGVGNSSAEMVRNGLEVECMDASSEMVKLARERNGLNVRQGLFSDLTEIDYYSGIWANFSLLHATKAELLSHISAIHRALNDAGIFFIALKVGTGEKRDKLGRFYVYYQVDELSSIVEAAGFAILETIGGASKGLSGNVEQWTGLLCRKIVSSQK